MLLRGDDTNPILHIEELPRFPRLRPPPVPAAVHVYLGRHGRVYLPAGGFTIGELWLLGPRRLYVVDVAQHSTGRNLDVISRSSGVEVSLGVSFSWQVRDPRFVVESHLVDVMTVIPEMVRVAVDEALSGMPWANARQLAGILQTGILPLRVRSDGIELSGVTAEVLALDEGLPAVRGADG